MRRLIDQSGLSLDDFADKTYLDAELLSQCIDGASSFSTVELAVIADEFHVSMDWLLTGADPALAVAARTTTGKAAEALTAARDFVGGASAWTSSVLPSLGGLSPRKLLQAMGMPLRERRWRNQPSGRWSARGGW